MWLHSLCLLLGTAVHATKRRELKIDEGAKVGTKLLNLNHEFYKDDPDTATESLLQVDPNGDVRLASALDHEELCTTADCHFAHTIMVMPQEVFERIELDLTIIDINDNAPHFTQSTVPVEVPEGESVRIEVPALVARDADAAAELRYEIENMEEFQLDVVDGRAFLEIKTPLDYEKSTTNHVSVSVFDQDGRSDTAEIAIHVLDRNDRAPVFKQAAYAIEIGEIGHMNTQVYKVTADDEDSGENGKISYSIVRAEPAAAKELFGIDAGTGQIYNRQLIQRQDYESITLTIKASDAGVPSLSAETTLTISIVDTNDHSPTIILTPCQPNQDQAALVQENQEPGAFVVWYSVSDLDLDSNGETDIRVEPASLFELIERDGLIVTKSQFDREQRDHYKLTVIACDRGQPKRCTEESIDIEIGDENDNAPVMTEKRVNVSFREDTELGTKLLQVRATDADAPDHFGKVKYTLDNEQSYYVIDSETGEIYLRSKFDYESATTDEFRVIASDPGGLNATTTIHVSIINTNDNSPILFVPSTVYIEPGFPIDRPVLNVTASDADGVKPILSLQGPHLESFYLIGTELFLAKNVTKNFEAELTIVAVDGEDTQSFRTEATVLISTKSGLSPLIAGITAGALIFFLLMALCILRIVMERKNYQIDYGNIKPSSRDDIVAESDYEPMMKYSSSDEHLTIKDETKSKHCSDSGRGESGEDDSILASENRNSREYDYASKNCTKDCYRLGHSDSCWLPDEVDFGIDVTSKTTNQTSLSVCDRTSDYSSQKSIQNTSREVIV